MDTQPGICIVFETLQSHKGLFASIFGPTVAAEHPAKLPVESLLVAVGVEPIGGGSRGTISRSRYRRRYHSNRVAALLTSALLA